MGTESGADILNLTSPPAEGQHLARRAARAAVFTFASQWLRLALRLASLAVLSRLLVPGDFGVFAMATAFTGIVSLLAETGFTNASIRARSLTQTDASTLFWGNLLLATGLAAVAALLGAPVSWFFGEPRLPAVISVLAVSLPVSALAAQHSAVLQRDLRFGRLVIAEVLGQTIGVGTAIAVALAGWDYWALVAQQLATVAATTLALWALAGWRPGRPAFTASTRGLLRSGTHLSVTEVLNYLRTNLDSIVVGKFTDSVALGEYNRANTLLSLPITQLFAPLSRVAIPTLSKLQDDPAHFRRSYLRMLSLVAMASTPLVAVLAATADDLVLVVLGQQFERSGVILRLLAIAAWGGPAMTAAFWIPIALGWPKRLNAVLGLQALGLLVAFLIGSKWGASGVAASFAVAAHSMRLPSIAVLVARSPVSLRDSIAATAPIGVASLASGLVMLTTRTMVPGLGPAARLGLTFVIGAAVIASAVAAMPHLRRQVREAVAIPSLLRRSPSSPRS